MTAELTSEKQKSIELETSRTALQEQTVRFEEELQKMYEEQSRDGEAEELRCYCEVALEREKWEARELRLNNELDKVSDELRNNDSTHVGGAALSQQLERTECKLREAIGENEVLKSKNVENEQTLLLSNENERLTREIEMWKRHPSLTNGVACQPTALTV